MEMGSFFQVPINYFAVLLGAISSMILGFLWYGPLFGSEWSKLSGMSKEKMDKDKMPTTYGVMFVSSLVMAYALAHFVWYAAPGNLTLFIAVKTAIWGWLGFIATYALSKFMFNPMKKSWTLLAIDTGYYLVTLVVMGVLFYFLPA